MKQFSHRYTKLLFNKTNIFISAVVLALVLTGNLLDFVTEGRAFFLFGVYVVFMFCYQAINAQFLHEEKYQIFEHQGLSALGNMMEHCNRFGRILHYIIMGLVFAVGLGDPESDPLAAYRGLSTMGLVFAGIYGIFLESTIKRQKKQAGEVEKNLNSDKDKDNK